MKERIFPGFTMLRNQQLQEVLHALRALATASIAGFLDPVESAEEIEDGEVTKVRASADCHSLCVETLNGLNREIVDLAPELFLCVHRACSIDQPAAVTESSTGPRKRQTDPPHSTKY
jgi:hypothetical protein